MYCLGVCHCRVDNLPYDKCVVIQSQTVGAVCQVGLPVDIAQVFTAVPNE